MADDNYNDEYQFSDLDAPNLDSTETNKADEHLSGLGSAGFADNVHKTNVKRNALLAVLGLVILVVTYPFVSSMFSTKKTSNIAQMDQMTKITEVKTTPIPFSQPVVVTAPVVSKPVVAVSENLDSKINQKLSSLEVTQQQVQTDVAATNNQLNSMSNTMSDMLAKIAELNRTLADFTTKMEAQSREIEQLTLRVSTPKVVAHRPKTVNAGATSLKYYIQAVIPGRAWLIATNGTTLDVREGNVIAGYGVVKLIDPQGRVITSSGQVIQFSQRDS